MNISIDKLAAQLFYDSNNPLLFNSSFFMYFFLFFFVAYFFTYKVISIRLVVVVVFSFYFIYKACGLYLFFLLLAAVIDFNLSNFIYATSKQSTRKLLLVISILLNLGLLFYFKYTNFFIEIINDIQGGSIEPFNLILPIGISFYTFENLSYTIDVYQNKFKPVNKFIDYLFFLSFFPKLMMGPIVRASDFIPQIRKEINLSDKDVATGFFLILTGLFKKVVISDFIYANIVSFVFEAPGRYTGLECLIAVYGYALVIYCDFSGYSDMAIGIARWMGLTIDKNFEAPYQSSNITIFWRKWHISLSNWLRDYLYIPLGGNRKGKVRTYLNLLFTMILGGLWHGASWNFVLWGFMHGVALAVHKFFTGKNRADESLSGSGVKKFFGIVLTFHFVCFIWIFFKCITLDDSLLMVHQIFMNFHIETLSEFLPHYRNVILVILLGYVLHFLPLKLNDKIIQMVSSTGWLWKGIVAVLVLMWIAYFKQAEPIMPVYLQF
ncbi:MAG TPA: MBOAT family O-acyltransferase [Cytophagaceae bacterium]|jgi:alginate O-acetyltransferase complex protein AlgI|nr:MBOAT family O-acyltransferase [Cytophagaceae bacterium]